MPGRCLKTIGRKSLPVLFLALIFTLGVSIQEGVCQYYDPYFYVNPYFSLTPITPWVPYPFAPPPLLFPAPQYFPAPVPTLPLVRYPAATIILSTGITAISPTAGALVVGAPTIISPTTTTSVISTAVPTVAAVAAPAPLLSILSIIYASALFAHTGLLSTANPLLFAYLSTLAL